MISLYLRLIGARIRAQMQYKASFALELIGFGLITGVEFAVIVFLFTRFPSVAGWGVAEIGLLYGLTSCAFSLAEMIGRGFDSPFERMIECGTFDAVLTRPQGTLFQVLASEFQLRRLGRTAQGVAVLGYAFNQLAIDWTGAKVLLIPLTLAAGTVIYLAIFLIGATVCFWTIKAPEVINVFTSGGEFLTDYPFSIYSRWLRTIFLWIIPLAFVNYPAALVLLDRIDPHGLPSALAWCAPLVAGVFMAVAWAFFQFGVSKYQSAGS